ncbi:MAG: phage head morphogenesis protein [Gammaproteobacteria bacterium]|nr:phage head morphogenesis protein [Gammaproteobacteria bacterium]MCP5013828.1 phage head morphogenesis protein [Ketobacter sp.]
MSAAEKLIEISTRHQVHLERLKAGEANQFTAFLQTIDASVRARLLGVDLTDFSRTRLERLLSATDAQLKQIYSDYADQLNASLLDLANYEAQFEVKTLSSVTAGFETVLPASAQIVSAVTTRPLSVRGTDGGKLLDAFIKDWTSNEVRRVSGAVRQGFYEGQTTAQIVQAIRGTRKARYTDGILAISSRNARAVAHTAVQHASSMARQATWERNSDLVQGVRWVSTLDSRTSQTCRSLDGKVFEINKGPRPPIHINCRSTTAPKLDSRFDIFDEGATRASSGPDGGGQVDANQNYYEWLKKQPKQFIESAIGKKRAKLLIDGGLTPERFAELNIGRNFEPLTLAQMKSLEPTAFESAGI